jgi:hypothetical protein
MNALARVAVQLFHDLAVDLVTELSMRDTFAEEPPLFFVQAVLGRRARGEAACTRRGSRRVRTLKLSVTHYALNDTEDLDRIFVQRAVEL